MAKPTSHSLSDAREMKRRMHSTKNSDRKPHADFPTPLRAAKWMVHFADIYTDTNILEPSAGEGRIVTALIDWHWTHKFDKPIHIDAVEIDPINWPLLDGRCSDTPDGVNAHAIHADFMKWQPPKGKLYDFVLMNPPFNQGAWLKHIEKALSHLKDEGTLIAIIPNSPITEKLAKLLANAEWELSLLSRGLFEESGAKGTATCLLEVKHKVCDFIRAVNRSAMPNLESAHRIRELITKMNAADEAQANGGWADAEHTIPSNSDDVVWKTVRRDGKTYREPIIYEWDDDADGERIAAWEKEANDLAVAMGFKCIDFSSNFYYNAITADDRKVFIDLLPTKVIDFAPDENDDATPRKKKAVVDRGLNLLTYKQSDGRGSWVDEWGYDDRDEEDEAEDDDSNNKVFENTTPDAGSWAAEQMSMF